MLKDFMDLNGPEPVVGRYFPFTSLPPHFSLAAKPRLLLKQSIKTGGAAFSNAFMLAAEILRSFSLRSVRVTNAPGNSYKLDAGALSS